MGRRLCSTGTGARAAIARGGIAIKRAEGDGVTPIGTFAIRCLLYHADRVDLPRTNLPFKEIGPDHSWSNAPQDSAYNTEVKRTYGASHEALWRDDPLYDLGAVLGFNDDPVVLGKGSATFLHVTRPHYGPTEGCLALASGDLLELLAALGPGDVITVRA